MKPQLVLIDLDGTMVDSVPDIAYCVDRMMEKLDRPTWGEDRVRDWVGNGVERLVRRALIGRIEGEPAEAEFDRAYPLFLDLYGTHNGERSVLYPGVRKGLEFLRSAGMTLGCVTNKAARFTTPLLKSLGIDGFFKVVISGDELPMKKPDPLPLLHAAEAVGADPARALMIGDSVNDVKAARAAGFQVVCVSYGYNHGRDIREAEPDDVIDSLAELEGLMGRAA